MTAAHARPRAIRRFAALAGACALAVATLTGCLSINADVTISPDATGTGTFSFALQKQAASFMGITDLAAFEKTASSGDLSGAGAKELKDCKTSETDTDFVYTCSFDNQEFTTADGLWTITKEGNAIVFHVVSKAQGGTQASDATALLGDASLGDVTINVTFPGPITAVTGAGAEKTSDTTAKITGSMTDTIDVTITGDASSSMPLSTILVVVVALAVLALIIVVLVVLLMRRRKPAELTAADVAAAEAVAVPLAAGSVVTVASTEEAVAVVAEGAVEAPETVVAEETVVTDAVAPVEETVVAVEEAPAEVIGPATEVVAEPVAVEETVVVVEAVEDAPSEETVVAAEPTTDEPTTDEPKAE
jgi:hypothetical protein